MKRLSAVFFVILLSSGVWACTNFIVGKGASTTGSPMTTYAADSYSLYGFLRYQPAAEHAEGEMRKIYDWDTGEYLGEIPEVKHTYSVIGNVNEHQLTIGETTWGGREELHDTTGIIDYGSLIYMALERCKTAREALSFMTDIVQEWGYYSEGESFTIADPDEVWVMEMIGKGGKEKGAVWVAVRVPDDCITAHANQARITELPLKGAKQVRKQVICSPEMRGGKQKSIKKTIVTMGNVINGVEWQWSADVIDFARKAGIFSAEDAQFSFADVYAPLDIVAAYACEGRVWSFLRQYDESIDYYLPYVMGDNYEHLPLFVRPNRQLSAADLRRAMRDQYEDTPLDITKGEAAGIWHSKLRYGGLTFMLDSVQYCYPRPTATQQTGWSFVSEMHKDLPYSIFWFAVDDAATSVYVPFFSSNKHVPYCLQRGNGDLLTYSNTSAFWAFNTVANFAYSKYERMLPDIQERQQAWENRFEEEVQVFAEKGVSAQQLDNYSSEQADAVVQDWHQLFAFLMVKYLDGVEKKQDEKGEFLRTPTGESQSPNRFKPSEDYLRRIAPNVAH